MLVRLELLDAVETLREWRVDLEGLLVVEGGLAMVLNLSGIVVWSTVAWLYVVKRKVCLSQDADLGAGVDRIASLTPQLLHASRSAGHSFESDIRWTIQRSRDEFTSGPAGWNLARRVTSALRVGKYGNR